MTIPYRDTLEFIPVDVDKGIDRLTGKMVKADASAPDGYGMVAKCKFCKNYTEEKDYIGICEASEQTPKFIAYGDMLAVTCNQFQKI
ncbi:4-hydroxyphenylacetate decarboxylase small subunit [Desulfobotulus sp. H1]|uniref:4-hydroxyphenylacetate decarboxylase small subunit n=1 Tax=Desulfobotulus pelophilus TaxID=2823377 RepID=A0ABT3NBM5_9BACT|nr:4-hydroxyphenylacetate decarboxylase small subunit [Desulfobotulus pelophilus]MCW7754863.1 4-hydroxyphenylacetate decarboxylase small subunit [Desulfobotulus pelophilus]